MIEAAIYVICAPLVVLAALIGHRFGAWLATKGDK